MALQYFWEAPNQVLSGRVESWQTLWNFMAAEPWHLLLGIGYKTLPYSDFIGSKAIGDNTYLSLLVETGILGLAAVVALNIAILFTCAARVAIRRSSAIVLRDLDVLLLGRANGTDVFGRFADLLACAAGLSVRARAGRERGSGLGARGWRHGRALSGSVQRAWAVRRSVCWILLPAIEERGMARVRGSARRWTAGGFAAGARHASSSDSVRALSIRQQEHRGHGASFTRDLRQQVKILRTLQFDLLYVNGPRMLTAAAVAFGDRVPVLFHAHSRIPAGPQSWLADWSLRRLNTTVAACAQAVAPRVSSDKLKLIPNGTPDLSGATPGRGRRHRRPTGEIDEVPKSGSRGTRADQGVRPTENWRIGMIGAIRPEKGQA